ncbi:DUF1642 domain-containing protein [Lactococcus petauri]|uniref:DUF1642 domain-containing protein n=1 Tax=Lactococcus petauri TaxID=1940789 RepID=UPI0022DF57FD|nr:DUF1642 domain-containing protein [Lactococcus petauri]
MKKFEEKLRTLKEKTLKLDWSPGIRFWYDLSTLVNTFGDWVSPEDHQFKVGEVQDDLSCANEEIERLNAKLEKQQPEIPECVAEFIENYDDINETSLLYIMKDFVESNHWDVFCEIPDNLKKYGRWDDMLYKAIRFGYTVAKEKRYEVVFLEDDTTRQILMENNAGYYFIEEESENYGYWKQDFTEMEIKEINEKFWQLSVPVKDEQIEVVE